MRRIISALFTGVLLLVSLTSCFKEDDPLSDQIATQDLTFLMALPQTVVDSTQYPVLSIYYQDSLISQTTLIKEGNAFGGTITSLPVGVELTFTLELQDAEGSILYEGSTLSILKSGIATEVKIILKRATGSATIIGIIEDSTTVVPDTIIVSGNSLVDETYIFDDIDASFSNRNYGLNPWIIVGNHGTDGIYSSLIRFNLTSVSSSKPITKATLILTVGRWFKYTETTIPDVNISIHKVLQDWNEGKGGDPVSVGWTDSSTDHKTWLGVANSSVINGATGDESSYGTSWSNKFATTATTSFSIPYIPGSISSLYYTNANQTIRVDVTSLVNDWLTKPSENLGLALVENGDVFRSDAHPIIMSNENTRIGAQGPTLEIIQ